MMRKAYTPPWPSESQIQETCSQFLALDGWRRIRTDLKQLRGMGVQERGMADDLFIRYTIPWIDAAPVGNDTAFTETMWVEWKARKGVHGDKQREWQAGERARGALVVVAKVDFPATIEGFQDWYRKSGLARNYSL
jgi:hypothetical protein